MGLDIAYYSKVERVSDRSYKEATDAEIDSEETKFFLNYRCFQARGEGLGPTKDVDETVSYGEFKCTGEEGFRAGSYSGYGTWRDALSKRFLGASSREVNDDPERYKDKPFFELVCFADNEGVFGPVVSAKLAKDFAQHQPGYGEEDEWFIGLYNAFRTAFEKAASEGAVEFC